MDGGAPPLAGIRVVEHADALAATYAGYLLRELGAEVIRLEAGKGPRASGEHVLQRGKHSVAIESAGSGCVAALRETADVVLGDETAPPDPAGPIACRVTMWGPG